MTPGDASDRTESTECEQCGREVPVAVYTEHLLKECPGDAERPDDADRPGDAD